MSKTFDTEEVARQLFGPVGFIRCLRDNFVEMKVGGGLWGGANEFLITVVKSHLVGVSVHVDELLTKARQWIDVVIAEGEPRGKYPQSFLQSEHRVTWTVANWLRGHADDLKVTSEAAEAANQYLTEHPDSVAERFALGLESLKFLEGRKFSEFVHWAKASGKLALGTASSKIRGEAAMTAAICLAETEGTYSTEEIGKALKRLLDMKINEWLTTGNELRAARWLKYTYGQQGLSPREVVLKAYDHLPDSSKPSFLASAV